MRGVLTLAMTLFALVVTGSPSRAAEGRLGVELIERNGRVVILKVIPNTSAAAVGIQPGDILVKVGAKRIRDIQDALDAKQEAANNEDIPFLFRTPGGLWPVNARFEMGQPYGQFSTEESRPE